MKIFIPDDILQEIYAHEERAYPEEVAGLLFGLDKDGRREIVNIFPLKNSREDDARRNRYLITPQDMLLGENEADKLDLDIIGIFHSHPDHPNSPSEFDREWALPWFSYIITSVEQGKSIDSRSWRLTDDRSRFESEEIIIIDKKENTYSLEV